MDDLHSTRPLVSRRPSTSSTIAPFDSLGEYIPQGRIVLVFVDVVDANVSVVWSLARKRTHMIFTFVGITCECLR